MAAFVHAFLWSALRTRDQYRRVCVALGRSFLISLNSFEFRNFQRVLRDIPRRWVQHYLHAISCGSASTFRFRTFFLTSLCFDLHSALVDTCLHFSPSPVHISLILVHLIGVCTTQLVCCCNQHGFGHLATFYSSGVQESSAKEFCSSGQRQCCISEHDLCGRSVARRAWRALVEVRSCSLRRL